MASHTDEGELEARLPGYRFGIVLLLLFATFVVMAAAPPGTWVRVVTVGLQGATLVAAFAAARVTRRWLRVAVIVAVVALVASFVAAVSDQSLNRGLFLLLDLLLVGATPVVIGRSIWRRGVVDVRTVLGALCIYVMLGMLWAFVYGAVGGFMTEPFFAQTAHATSADYLYFSFVTQTTVGYGDLTAADGLGRAFAVLEALFGQLYLVTIVAVLVARLAIRPRADAESDTSLPK